MLILITLIIGFHFFWQYYVRQFKPLISRILVYSSIRIHYSTKNTVIPFFSTSVTSLLTMIIKELAA